jgi:hypothetical protein
MACLLVACAVVSGSWGSQLVFGASQSDAVAALAAAEAQLVQCYEAVAEADAVGASVTALVGQLNQAGDLLSRAELQSKRGSYDAAISLAIQSEGALDGVLSDAEALTERAIVANYQDFLVNVVGSSVGAIAVVGSGVAAWWWFTRRDRGAEPPNQPGGG